MTKHELLSFCCEIFLQPPSDRLLKACSISNIITNERLLGILRLCRGVGGSSSRG